MLTALTDQAVAGLRSGAAGRTVLVAAVAGSRAATPSAALLGTLEPGD